MENEYSVSNGLIVEFFTQALQNKSKTIEKERPIFDDFEFVKISIIGDKNTEVIRKATAEDKRRYNYEYSFFIENKEVPLEGTPIEEWPIIAKSQCEELKFVRVRTVEDLANLPEETVKNLGMGYLDLSRKAKSFIGDTKSHTRKKLAEDVVFLKEKTAELEKLLSDNNNKINIFDEIEKQNSALIKENEELKQGNNKLKK